MRALTLALIVSPCLWASTAVASLPTIDAAQLTQHARTSSATVQLVPITTKRKDANSGVHCAVTTGRKGTVTDPTVQPQTGAGSPLIQSYAPDMPASPAAGVQGANLNSQTLFRSAGDVAAGVDAGRATTVGALSGFQAASRMVGTATTVMAAVDMNSASRLQNGLAWNSVAGSADLWVQALNALNLAATSDASRAAIGMRTSATPAPSTLVGLCPVGFTGSGTGVDPCRSAACPGSSSTCTSGTVTDARGDVVVLVAPAADLPADLAAVLQILSSTAP